MKKIFFCLYIFFAISLYSFLFIKFSICFGISSMYLSKLIFAKYIVKAMNTVTCARYALVVATAISHPALV